jgi:hypothetical protein
LAQRRLNPIERQSHDVISNVTDEA